ncbi:ester cyclase [Aeromonas schubertii]|uniref:ester cyclase n=1 Tax=Aeromonas schubertii TaxID=652 RepID=UPI00067F3E35|nr:ester cyclase [Aeromonas schubertii]KUE80955.1 ester cyclase [Aeromonas schubertii]
MNATTMTQKEYELPTPEVLEGAQLAAPVVHAARLYAAFWNSGNPDYARAALNEHFIDRTPPAGRKPGVEGVVEASNHFREAVPNLHVRVEHILVTGEYATIRYRFMGHFTGRMGELQGEGQTIDFQAVDVYRVKDKQIVDNWHLEDYNTLFEQMGMK